MPKISVLGGYTEEVVCLGNSSLKSDEQPEKTTDSESSLTAPKTEKSSRKLKTSSTVTSVDESTK